ncbi:MAG TPA: aldehyde dehydrogenase family protein [Candidatus Acidoferrum sp.]|nr:aldehyde dehydrogenase family protein [Candidatus Acidoferrum sp.]
MAATAIPIGALPSIDPATGEVLAHVAATPASQIPHLVALARAAQAKWAVTHIAQRCALLAKLRERILLAREALADAVVLESGKPRVEALFADIFVSLDTAAYYAKEAPRHLRDERVPHHSLAAKTKSGKITCEPIGVLAMISSWNYPLAIPLGQMIPAVAAGNAVVCKTSDFTPRCGGLIQKLFADAGFPEGLVTVVQGGADVAQALIAARPDKVFFTGSVVTGKRVAESCAKDLIPSVLELGGKDAMVVLADANIENAANAAVWGSFTNCGQVCLSVERLFVEGSVADEFLNLCVEKAKKLRLGPGNHPATDIGPLIRPQQVRRMQDLVEDAVTLGATVLCGGHACPDLGPNFFEPTILSGVHSSMKLFREETFGPILAVQVVANEEEAIAGCNDSDFALAASVFTGNAARGQAIARRIRAGSVMVNDAISYFGIAEAPHGGCKLSGWGRTHGKAGLMEMVQPKYIATERMPGMEKPWWFRYGGSVEKSANAFLKFEFGATLATKIRHARQAMKTIFRDHGLH